MKSKLMLFNLCIVFFLHAFFMTNKLKAQNGVIPKYKEGTLFRSKFNMKRANGYKRKFILLRPDKSFVLSPTSSQFKADLESKVEDKFKTKTKAEKASIVQHIIDYYVENKRVSIKPDIIIYARKKNKKVKIYYNDNIGLTYARVSRAETHIDDKRKEKQDLIDDMTKPKKILKDSEFKAMELEVEEIDGELDMLSKNLDSLQSYGYFLSHLYRPVFFPIAFPFNGHYHYLQKNFNEFYYSKNKGFSLLTGLDATFAKGVTNINTELVSGFFGIMRVSLTGNANLAGNLSAVDSVKHEELEQAAEYQKIFSNGGQISLNLSAPIFIAHSSAEDFHTTFSLFTKSATDIFANGAVDTVGKFVNQVGGNLYIDFLTSNQAIGISAELPFAYVRGNNAFSDAVGLTDYSLLQCSVGIMINGKFKIKMTGPLWSSQAKLMSLPWTIGFQLSP